MGYTLRFKCRNGPPAFSHVFIVRSSGGLGEDAQLSLKVLDQLLHTLFTGRCFLLQVLGQSLGDS